MPNEHSLIVFTDLDGTLLDHETYAWQQAEPALARLKQMKIPVILASSKTAAEIEPIQSELGLAGYPAIIENGAGIHQARSASTAMSDDYTRLRKTLDGIPKRLRALFKGFGDMSIGEIVDVTGLPATAANRAQSRRHSEPGLWSGSIEEQQVFSHALREFGVHVHQGGRFLTLSFGRTKQDLMPEIASLLGAKTTIALGDAPNDLEMLQHADYGFIVANPHHDSLPPLTGEREGKITRTLLPGPEGWNAAMNDFLDELASKTGGEARV